jgi:hypothetical protein
MVLIARTSTRSYYLTRLKTPSRILEAFGGAAFPCLVWDANTERTTEQRHVMVASLMDAGCRYFVCGGPGCADWEEEADEAFVMATLDVPEPERDARFVMTSAHRGESVDDVAFFFVCNTNFDAHAFERFLVLVIGADEEATERLCSAVRAHANAAEPA